MYGSFRSARTYVSISSNVQVSFLVGSAGLVHVTYCCHGYYFVNSMEHE